MASDLKVVSKQHTKATLALYVENKSLIEKLLNFMLK